MAKIKKSYQIEQRVAEDFHRLCKAEYVQPIEDVVAACMFLRCRNRSRISLRFQRPTRKPACDRHGGTMRGWGQVGAGPWEKGVPPVLGRIGPGGDR